MSRIGAGRVAAHSAVRKSGFAAVVLCAAAALGGCSASMIDSLPTEVGGLPANAPKRSTAVTPYPTVGNVRDRDKTPLTSEQQFQLEEELNNARARQKNLQNKDSVSRAHAEAEKTNAARVKAIEAANASRREAAPR